MSLVGMFHYRKDPRKVSRAYRYASVAKLEGIEFFYFTSKRVDFEVEKINGLIYENGEWVEKDFPFPDVIINHVGPITRKQYEIYNRLKKLIPFTSHPIGTKISVYNRLKKAKEFSDYLIPYKKIRKPIDVLTFLNLYQKVIIKPISGNHGLNIIYIEKEDENYLIKENNDTKKFTKIQLYQYISELNKQAILVMQKYIHSKTKTGQPFDIRLHLQKDENGNWKNTIIYPKIGFKHKITTNLGQGGHITILKNFLLNEFGEDYFDVMKYLEMFSLQFAEHFESLYNHHFDELGIDIGLDEDKKIWLYEVNWRPGHIFIEAGAAEKAVKYANYLANVSKGGNNEDN